MDDLLEGDFEVVDECTEEDDANPESNIQQTNADDNDGIHIIDECAGDDDIMLVDENNQLLEPNSENVNSKKDQENQISDASEKDKEEASGKNGAGNDDPKIGLCQNQSNVELEDDVVCLDASEILESGPENETNASIDTSNVQNDQNENDVIINETEEQKIEEKMIDKNDPNYDEKYEKRFMNKVKTVEERLSKLARVLECSYPMYHNWLHKVRLTCGTSVCKLEPPKRCPLKEPYINRWKFMCNKTSMPEETNEEGTINKSSRFVWQMANSGSESNNECPDFVMRAVKVFENFIQATNQIPEEIIVEDESAENKDDAEKTKEKFKKPDWICLLVRSNRKSELMLFASGKNVSSGVMESLKELYTSGPGKDCNVKSLYCKTMSRVNNATQTNTTFLAGSETLDEEVNGIKVQLAPKTNFALNTDGVEVLATTIKDLLAPTPKTSIVEIGCGIGVLGLTLASKCSKVIGFDCASEVEEAEMICEINGIKNASFVTGQPDAVLSTIAKCVTPTKAAAIVNAGTNIARALEVTSGLRKINSLRRLVMVTTLTKQSVRSILDLTRPATASLGNPFIPVRAYVVDTLPYGSDYEIAILMERRMMQTLLAPIPAHLLQKAKLDKSDKTENKTDKSKEVPKTAVATPTKEASAKDPATPAPKVDKPVATPKPKPTVQKKQSPLSPSRKNAPEVVANQSKFKKKPSPSPQKKKFVPPFKRNFNVNPFQKKRPFLQDRFSSPAEKGPMNKKFKPWFQQEKRFEGSPRDNRPISFKPRDPNTFKPRDQGPNFKPRDQISSPYKPRDPGPSLYKLKEHVSPMNKRKRDWQNDIPVIGVNPLHKKKPQEEKAKTPNQDLRQQLSGRRDSRDPPEEERPEEIIQKLKEQIGQNSIDVNTAKQLQIMLNKLVETSKLSSQVPVSVWDRIEPPSHNSPVEKVPPSMKNRFIQETNSEDIRITTPNKQYGSAEKNKNIRSRNHSYGNAMQGTFRRQDMISDHPPRPVSPPRHRVQSPISRRSPPRPVPAPRGMSPTRPTSPYRRQVSPFRSHLSPPIGQSGAIDPSHRDVSPTSRVMRRSYNSPPRRDERFASRDEPARFGAHDRTAPRSNSPSHHASSPARFIDEWDIPTRGAVEQNFRPMDIGGPSSRAMDTRERWSSGDRRSESTKVQPWQIAAEERLRKQAAEKNEPNNWEKNRNSGPMQNSQISTPWRALQSSIGDERRSINVAPEDRQRAYPISNEGGRNAPNSRCVNVVEELSLALVNDYRSSTLDNHQRSYPMAKNVAAKPSNSKSQKSISDEYQKPFATNNDIPITLNIKPVSNVSEGYKMPFPAKETPKIPVTARPVSNVDEHPRIFSKDNNTLNKPAFIRSSFAINDEIKKSWPMNNETLRNQGLTESRWGNSEVGGGRSVGDNWNQREKDNFPVAEMRRDDFRPLEKSRWDAPNTGLTNRFQMDKDDCDLPEDARDPWGDDNADGPKDRWSQGNLNFGQGFQREKEPIDDSWKNDSGNNWQNRSTNMNKSPWQNISNMVNESRWPKPGNEMPRFQQQGGNQPGPMPGNVPNWQPQNFGFQQQRSFPMNPNRR